MKFNSRESLGVVYAISSGLLFGFVGYCGLSLMQSNLSISNMQFWRFFISTIFLCPFLILRFKRSTVNIVELLKAFFLGVLFFSGSASLYFVGSQYIGSGLTMVIFFIYPAIVMLLNWYFYKQVISRIYYIAIMIIFLGMTQLVDFSDFESDLIGISMAIGSAILYALYIVFSKNIKLSPITSTIMVSFGSGVISLIIAVWDRQFTVPALSQQWIYIIGFGIVSTAVPILLLLESVKKIGTDKASILSVLQPVFVVIIGVLLLEENVTLAQTVGMITILTGALITLFSKKCNDIEELVEQRTPDHAS